MTWLAYVDDTNNNNSTFKSITYCAKRLLLLDFRQIWLQNDRNTPPDLL
jgi:hypothetical protein